MKKEELYKGRYKSEKELKQCVLNYIELFNNERPHASLKYKTPVQYELEMAK